MSTTPVPYTPPFQKISDRKVNVAMKLGNRQDLLLPAPGSVFTYSRLSGWLRDAYISIAYARTFEQSEFTYQFQTVPGQDTYTLQNQARAPKALTGFDQNGTPVIVSWTSIADLRRYNLGNPPGTPATINARPSLWTLWNQSLIFRPVPNAQLTFYFDYWQKPLITLDIDSTPLLVPDDWLEIIDYQAAIRGNAELQQADKSREMQELLFGYTDPTNGRLVPGLIEELENRQQAMQPYVDWSIKPQYKQGYTK